MAEPRKVPFVTLSAFTAVAAPPGSEARKRRLDADTDPSLSREPGPGAPEAAGPSKTPGQSQTVRINIPLPESSELSFPEYNYNELLQKKPPVSQTRSQFKDEQQRQEVEALARKYEEKYGSECKKKRTDRVQDLVDIGFGYDESDSFIDNSEAYDELVPATLTTKLGGFYINTGTLQFRNASESESDEAERRDRSKCDEDSEVKIQKRRDEAELEEKRKNNCLAKRGVCHLEKKKRRKKKLMVAAMLRRFAHEKTEIRKLNPTDGTKLLHNDTLLSDLTSDPAMMSLLTSASESELQDLLNDLDFSALDTTPQTLFTENGPTYAGVKTVGGACLNRGVGIVCPLPLPEGLPAPLVKRIEDLRVASRQFDEEGRKKFFTLDMNNILLDIELQVQEQSPSIRSAVYSHLEAFVPCNKEALLKRLKKLSLNIQDDRLRTPLLKLKLAVCSVMPEQTARYNMDCMAKVAAKQQMEDGERNGSDDEEEEKPGKRVIGPRKKFIWDDKLRTLLCNLVRVKLKCYEQEKSSLSLEDYLKVFMENEVKPLWPKGWMQARMLFKESHTVHGHLTDLGKKRIISNPRPAKMKEMGWQLGTMPGVSPAPFSTHSPSEPICLSDSLDEDLAMNSLDSIAQALTLLNNSSNGVKPISAPSTSSSPVVAKPPPHTESPAPFLQSSMSKDVSSVQRQTVIPVSRPSNASMSTMSAAKPRPPPTTTPLQKPFGTIGLKPSQATPPPAQMKNAANKVCDSGVQQQSLNSVNTKSLQQLTTPPSSSSPHLQKKAPPTGHHQQRFITPMQATITKSSQSSNSPIIKLTHRPPAHTTPPGSSHCPSAQTRPSGSTHRPTAQSVPPGSTQRLSVSTPSPPCTVIHPTITPSPSAPGNCPPALNPQNLGPTHRPPVSTLPPSMTTHRPSVSTPPSPSCHRPSAQTPPISAYRPSVPTPPPNLAHRSPVATPPSVPSPTPSSSLPTPPTQYSPKSSGFKPPFRTASVATPHSSSFQDCNLTSSSVTTNHGQRQRAVGGASQSNKSSANCASAMGLPSLSDPALLNQVPSVPLGLGMFGGLVPVSLPFQFPLLNFTPPGAATHTPNSGYTLTPNLFKSLQSGVQAALPPHLQLAFSESNQSQGGDVKRK